MNFKSVNPLGKSLIVKRSLVIAHHKTSISLEPEFWESFKAMAVEMNLSLSELAAAIDRARSHGNLSSAIRLAVFRYFDKRSVNPA